MPNVDIAAQLEKSAIPESSAAQKEESSVPDKSVSQKEKKASASKKEKSTENSEFLRAENEDDDGYDPYSDRRPVSGPLFERDPWS